MLDASDEAGCRYSACIDAASCIGACSMHATSVHASTQRPPPLTTCSTEINDLAVLFNACEFREAMSELIPSHAPTCLSLVSIQLFIRLERPIIPSQCVLPQSNMLILPKRAPRYAVDSSIPGVLCSRQSRRHIAMTNYLSVSARSSTHTLCRPRPQYRQPGASPECS